MATQRWDEAWNDLKRAWDTAQHGYKAVPREGPLGRILGPKYEPLGTQPPPTPSATPGASFASLEARLKQLHQLYESGQIDHYDYEHRKAEILREI